MLVFSASKMYHSEISPDHIVSYLNFVNVTPTLFNVVSRVGIIQICNAHSTVMSYLCYLCNIFTKNKKVGLENLVICTLYLLTIPMHRSASLED